MVDRDFLIHKKFTNPSEVCIYADIIPGQSWYPDNAVSLRPVSKFGSMVLDQLLHMLCIWVAMLGFVKKSSLES